MCSLWFNLLTFIHYQIKLIRGLTLSLIIINKQKLRKYGTCKCQEQQLFSMINSYIWWPLSNHLEKYVKTWVFFVHAPLSATITLSIHLRDKNMLKTNCQKNYVSLRSTKLTMLRDCDTSADININNKY